MTSINLTEVALPNLLPALQFTKYDNADFYDHVSCVFYSLLEEKWNAFQLSIHPSNQQILTGLTARLSGMELDAFMLQPSISRLLLQPYTITTQQFDFISQSLAAQVAKKEHRFDIQKYQQIWSANGDYLISYNREAGSFDEYIAPTIADTIPIDFFSPYCQLLSQADIQEAPDTQFELYSLDEAEQVLEAMEEATATLSNEKNFYDLIRQFNHVILVKKQINSDGKQPFISGSDGSFIGRTHVMNPHVVSTEVIAEMFVHEAIHTVLYMIEEYNAWMPDKTDAHRIGITVPSNWSGNRLSIRSYFQAVFVWFGLWNLWRVSYASGLYDKSWVLKRLDYIHRGFETLDIEAMIAKYNITVPPSTVDVIIEARRTVLKA